jgi:hypothetical protein
MKDFGRITSADSNGLPGPVYPWRNKVTLPNAHLLLIMVDELFCST